jgi:hypothetical protein
LRNPAFSGEVPRISRNFHITQGSSHWDIFEIFFSPEIFTFLLKETNQYAVQQIKRSKRAH